MNEVDCPSTIDQRWVVLGLLMVVHVIHLTIKRLTGLFTPFLVADVCKTVLVNSSLTTIALNSSGVVLSATGGKSELRSLLFAFVPELHLSFFEASFGGK